MTKPIELLVRLPFAGFYASDYSREIDSEEEREIEDRANERDDGEQAFPPELRLSEQELGELYFDHTDYSAAYHRIASWYPEAFTYATKERFELTIPLRFESMTSPREYNFETDKVYAFIPLKTVLAMFAYSKTDAHATLAEVIKSRHTSYDGFYSYYSNDLATWLSKPVKDWDHNELETLLQATLLHKGRELGEDEGAEGDGFRSDLFEAIFSGNGEANDAWASAVDWPALEAAIEEARADKAADLRAVDPELGAELASLPMRCPDTLDLFRGLQ